MKNKGLLSKIIENKDRQEVEGPLKKEDFWFNPRGSGRCGRIAQHDINNFIFDGVYIISHDPYKENGGSSMGVSIYEDGTFKIHKVDDEDNKTT